MIEPIGPVRVMRLDSDGRPTGEPVTLQGVALHMAAAPWWRRAWDTFMNHWPGGRILLKDPPGVPPRRVELKLEIRRALPLR